VTIRNSNEMTAVFEALAFSGVAFIVAVTPKGSQLKDVVYVAETTP
jgi:hypothetical protein